MSQRDVLKLLKKVDTITIKEASQKLGLSLTACWHNFKRLEKEGEIIKIEESCEYKYNGEKI